MKSIRLMSAYIFTLILFNLASSTLAQEIQMMKQLTIDTGWMVGQNRLFWTTSSGRDWREITPPQIDGQISAVFFVDGSRGWVVTAKYDEEAETHHFFIISTMNSGTTWSPAGQISTLETGAGPQNGSKGLNQNAWLYFVDEQHGYLDLGVTTGSAIPPSAVSLSTEDGGKTWKDNGIVNGGEMLFTTTKDGWITNEAALSVTHDAGKSWQDVKLPTPASVGTKEVNVIYKLPSFLDKDHGVLQVAYSGPEVSQTGLYSSRDGGRTWKVNKAVHTDERSIIFVAGAEWRKLNVKDHSTNVSSLSVSSPPLVAPIDPSLENVIEVNFLDPQHGWAIAAGDGPMQLLATSDAGAGWTIITPEPIRGNVVGNPPRPRTAPLI